MTSRACRALTTAIERRIDDGSITTVSGLVQELSQSERKDAYQRLVNDGFYLNDHSTGSAMEDSSEGLDDLTYDGPGDTPELTLHLALKGDAYAGGDIWIAKAKAGVTAGLEAQIGFDLNDLPNPSGDSGDPLDPTYPDSEQGYQYDGRVHRSELRTIWDADAQAVFNTLGDLSFVLKAYVLLEVLSVNIIDESVTIVDEPIFQFTIPGKLTDAQILAGESRHEPYFAAQEGDTLYLVMNNELRRYTNADRTGSDTITDERFDVGSLGWMDESEHAQGERIEVYFSENLGAGNESPYRHRCEFEGVRRIVAFGHVGQVDDHGDEMIVINSSVHADADLWLGAGNDTLIYQGTGTAMLSGGLGDDLLHGGPQGDELWGDEGNDRLYGGGGNDAVWGMEIGGFVRG